MADVTYIHVRPKATGKAKVDSAASIMINRANRDRNAVVEKAGRHVAGKRASINAKDGEITEAGSEIRAVDKDLVQKCGGSVHVPPFGMWVRLIAIVVGLIAEEALASALLDYAFLQGRPPQAPDFLQHFEERGFFEGLMYAISDYATQKEKIAVGVALYMFGAAEITGIWIRQRESGRSTVSTWLVVAANSVILAACVGYVFLRHAMMQGSPDTESIAYLAPVFLAIQMFFYAVACLWAAMNADPDPLAAGLAKRKAGLKKKIAKLVARRAELSSEVTSTIVGTVRKCDEIAAGALWDIAAYRHANLLYRDPNDEVPDFLTSPISPGVFEPVYLDPVPDLPADTMEAVLKATGSG